MNIETRFEIEINALFIFFSKIFIEKMNVT